MGWVLTQLEKLFNSNTNRLNLTIGIVLIYELVGPVFTRMALTAADEIKPISDEVKDRRKNKLAAVQNNK